MPTQSLIPQQDGYWQGWSSIVGGTFAYQAVSDGSDATYLLLPKLAGVTGRISFPVFLMADGLIPTSIQIVVRAKLDSGAAPTIQVGFTRGGVVAFDGTIDTLTGTIGNYVHTFSTDILAGGPWMETDTDGLEVCIQREAVTLGVARIINVSGTLTYSQARAWRSTASKNAQAA